MSSFENIRIAAFADEAGSELSTQIQALNRAGIDRIEIRGVDGTPFVNRTACEAKEISDRLSENGIKVWSVGSPLGKISVKDDFAPHLDLFKHTLELAVATGASCIRLFSFYIPEKTGPEDCRDEVFKRLQAFCDAAKGSGVMLCHENEKGIYGDNAVRCAELLADFPSLFGVFDSANFIQCGQDVKQAWSVLKKRIHYLHVKDAVSDGTVVPAGEGNGLYPEILAEFSEMGGGTVTLEPHLKVFSGLAGLEQEGGETKIGTYSYRTNEEAFAAAAGYLKQILGR